MSKFPVSSFQFPVQPQLIVAHVASVLLATVNCQLVTQYNEKESHHA